MSKRELFALFVMILATALTLRFYSAGMKYLGQEKPVPTAPHRSSQAQARDKGVLHKYTDYKWVGDADLWFFNANDNAVEYAAQYLWPVVPEMQRRAPCGGKAECLSPEQYEADCIVTVTDCKMDDGHGNYVEPTVLKTKNLRCPGLSNCWHEPGDAKRCCREVP